VIAGEYAVTLTTAQHLPIIAAAKGRTDRRASAAADAVHRGEHHDPQRHEASIRRHAVRRLCAVRRRQTVLRDAQYFPVNTDVQL